MRHRMKGTKLGRIKKRRGSMIKNLVLSVVLYEKINTTLAKAKATLPVVERLIHRAKPGDLNAKRYLMQRLFNNELLVKKMIKEIAPRYTKKEGGYLRIIKLKPREGDKAKMARLEFV